MARQPSIIRPYHLHTTIPEDLHAEVQLYLWSDVEQRVPHGALGRLICNLLRNHLNAVKTAKALQDQEG
jgi:hypothetical protein